MGAGLVRRQGDKVLPRCDAYAEYFRGKEMGKPENEAQWFRGMLLMIESGLELPVDVKRWRSEHWWTSIFDSLRFRLTLRQASEAME
jgi:hypothetical protein